MQILLEIFAFFIGDILIAISYGVGRVLLLFTFGKIKAEPLSDGRKVFSYRIDSQLYWSSGAVMVLGLVFIFLVLVVFAFISQSA